MKKIFYSLLTILTISQALNGCRKDDNGPDTLPATSPFSAKINSIPFNATSTYCLLNVDSDLQLRSFALLGMYQDQTLSISFMDTVLTEVVDSTSALNGLGIDITYSDSSAASFYTTFSSNLTFSKFDTLTKKTSGTFSGTLIGSGNDTLIITDGSFNDITYIWEHSN
jgi:hypothetical protein